MTQKFYLMRNINISSVITVTTSYKKKLRFIFKKQFFKGHEEKNGITYTEKYWVTHYANISYCKIKCFVFCKRHNQCQHGNSEKSLECISAKFENISISIYQQQFTEI